MKTTTRRRKTSAERKAEQLAALQRAENGQTCQNDVVAVMEFAARGINPEDIRPRENVFTYNAWKALGRYVRKGEKGVALTTWIPVKDRETGELKTKDGKIMSRPVTTYVFHISQTELIDAPKPETTAPAPQTEPEPTPAPRGWDVIETSTEPETEPTPAGMLF